MRKNSKKDRENIGRVGLRSDDFYYKVESGESVRSYFNRSKEEDEDGDDRMNRQTPSFVK